MPALMTGLVDGQENPLNNIIARKMWEAKKYVMMTSHMESVLAVFVNEAAFKGLPEGDRTILREALDEVGKRSLKWAAYAEAGKFDEAANYQRWALSLQDDKDPEWQAQLESRLELYLRRQPYREQINR
jgi:TRAP-type C4-dicarboxylate transport system substrate-binding protein